MRGKPGAVHDTLNVTARETAFPQVPLVVILREVYTPEAPGTECRKLRHHPSRFLNDVM